VRAVEKWREGTASDRFLQPAVRGRTRPGIYYVNLVDMNQTQKVQVAAIASMKARPAIISRSRGSRNWPAFLNSASSAAMAPMEGWGLYSERLANEMGVYKTPYDRFGMLSLQVWRAIRLVLDTGIHSKKWTREQSIAYFKSNSSVSDTDIGREVDRYFNWPGQATSYMVGQLKIVELRKRAPRRRWDREVRYPRFPRSGAEPGITAARRARGAGGPLHRGRAKIEAAGFYGDGPQPSACAAVRRVRISTAVVTTASNA
jgi:uncharacterized protein (DUF885 family)